MKRNMSMSMYFNDKKNISDIAIPKTTPVIWIPSENVTKCYNCAIYFSILNRKHHCRMCGRVFCNDCSSGRSTIPSILNNSLSPQNKSYFNWETEEKRLCTECFKIVNFIKNSKLYIHIFSNIPLSIIEIYNFRLVCKEWCKSINTVMSSYKNIQYKLPCQKIQTLERKFIINHEYEFSGHFHLFQKLLMCSEKKDIRVLIEKYDYNKNFSCNNLLCKRQCESVPKIEELLEMLYRSPTKDDPYCRNWIIKQLQLVNRNVIILLIPWFVELSKRYNEIAYNLLFPFAKQDFTFAFSYYFEIKCQMNNKQTEIDLYKIFTNYIKILDPIIKKEIAKTDNFIQLVHIATNEDYTTKQWENCFNNFFKINEWVRLPWNYKYVCTGIVYDCIIRFNSYTKPWKIPMIVEEEGSVHDLERVVNILIKNEDVRKDRLTMIVSCFINFICNGLVDIVTYNVFPVNDKIGWIEMVEQSSTLYEVKNSYESTLQNYILDFNPHKTIKDIRERFITTCVSSCVLCYVLGVGDRHLENILINKEGELIHIDFTYILGEDPQNASVEMKITQDMLDMLGGKMSPNFTEFKNRCKKSFSSIRRRSSLWYILFSYLAFITPEIPVFNENFSLIKHHILERLVPGENDKEASMQIINIVNRSSNALHISDWTHDWSVRFNNLKDSIFNFELT